MMKVFISIKFYEDNRNQELINSISSIFEKKGFETICVIRDVEDWGQKRFETSEELMRKTFEEIDSSDLVVVELSEKGVGLGIEAGYAFAKGKPIVTIARTGSDISSTLQGISQQVFLYTQYDELEQLFVQA